MYHTVSKEVEYTYTVSVPVITVVAAAGNYGLDWMGRETFGTISAPGNDPSVITVGSLNSRTSPRVPTFPRGRA